NRDNFWNLMLWFGISFSWPVILFVGKPVIDSGAWTFLLVILFVVPYLAAQGAKVSFDKEKGFLNKEGKSLKNVYPRKFGMVIFLTILSPVLILFLAGMLQSDILIFLVIGFLLPLVLLTPTLYFIIKNCPITILFNKNAWCEEVTGMRQMTPEERARFDSISSKRSDDSNKYRTSPAYRHLISNIHHRN
ncbi:MAG: hypothetical protein WCH62_08465, partial [Candidatus Omnitrophota bacterium]